MPLSSTGFLPHRGYILLALSATIILVAFFIFVAVGWPGGKDECLNDSPHTCFCERVNPEDVTSHKPGIRQKTNTLSNLYAIVTALIVSLVVFFDRRSASISSPPNLMKSKSLIVDAYIFAVLFLGFGSMWYHGSMTAWGSYLDGMSMYVYAGFLVFYTLRRMVKSELLFWLGYLGTIIVFTALHKALGNSAINIGILVLAYIILEVILGFKAGKHLLIHNTKARTFWISGLVSMALATFFWIFSQKEGQFLCNPDSWFQPHGLLWHPLAGVMAVFIYFYWRLADEPETV